MAWGKVDDGLYSSTKWRAAKKGSRALWTTALSWSMDQLTDGAIPRHVLPMLDGTRGEAADLVRVGLWEVTDDGWLFHDWAEYQPSRDQVLAERGAAKERQRRARVKAKEARESRTRHAVTHGDVTPDVTVPPTRPLLPEPDGSGSAAPTAQTLLAKWIDHCRQPPTARVKGHVARELGGLLNEGIPVADVEAGLAEWHRRNLHPSTLSSVVHELRQGPRQSAGKPMPMDRVAATVALGQEMQDELERQQIGA